MKISKKIYSIYNKVSDLIHQIENERDYGTGIDKNQELTLEKLNQCWDIIRLCPHFSEGQLEENGEIRFDFVTIDWIKQQLKDNQISQREMAAGVNVDERQISDWLSGRRNPSSAAKAAIWYFFHK